MRVPLVLHACGDTVCKNCLTHILAQSKPEFPKDDEPGSPSQEMGVKCPTCQIQIQETSPEECRKNVKIINFLLADEAQPLVQGSLDSIPCPKHQSKIIDYFCKTCSASVCSKCIYDDHNGHSLMPIEEVSNSLKQNVIDLRKMLDNSYRLIYENQNLMGQVKEELERLMEI